ncbi:MAG: 16S rRNA (cytidine(1402)-2'-O)-methyltransferase [Candidatus Nealsonbacteria bacterium]
MSTLYVVATPIGNLEDLSQRALRILSEVDLILCEDTRVTSKLLSHYQIKTSTLSYHQHSELNKVNEIIDLLKSGKNLALVSDAGTPGISDPGNKLVAALPDSIKIVPVSGPSALVSIASVAGFPMDKFLFLGFPPHKNKRQKFFNQVADSQYPVVLYESPYRILKTLADLNSVSQELKLVVGRELTKKFETLYRGTAQEILKQLKKEKIRGEFVIVIDKK